MSTSVLAQVLSLGILGSATEAPRTPNFDIWLVNHLLIYRVGANNMASLLSAIPRSETRLRDEGIIPLYSFTRNISNILKSSAHERGSTAPAIPDTLADWSEEASADYNFEALAAQFRPHLAEPARATLDWFVGLRGRDPQPHWTSEVAVDSVMLDLFILFVPAMAGIYGGSSEWGAFMALIASTDLKRISGVISEEALRIRAQPGSGWDDEEAKRLVAEQLVNTREMATVGT